MKQNRAIKKFINEPLIDASQYSIRLALEYMRYCQASDRLIMTCYFSGVLVSNLRFLLIVRVIVVSCRVTL